MHRRLVPALAAVTLFASACAPPPPAPEGLDASTSYLMREFYNDDAIFQAGIQGFMSWYFEEGYTLVGDEVTLEETDAFTIDVLSEEDVSHFPLADDGRDLSRALGVVSLAEMDCSWLEAEEWLVRPDQDVVFSNDWEAYDRTYVTPREDYQAASTSEVFAPVENPLEPFLEGFDGTPWGSTMLFTHNLADPSPVLGADLPSYDLYLDFRHGIYDVEGERTGVFAIITYNREEVWGPNGSNGLLQSYSVEINVQRPNDRTLRMLAVWAEPASDIELPESAQLNYAVNKSLRSSNRLSEICAGLIEVE